LIHAYKYEGVKELRTLFADIISSFLDFYAIRPSSGSVLVPIPLHRSRERSRGFNQSQLLAEELGARLGLDVAAALKRSRATEQQIEMKSYEARRRNIAGAFAIADAESVRGKPAILVDDVSTSGATLSEAARTLRGAGARTVWAITIAKG
jgi:ComF family protein